MFGARARVHLLSEIPPRNRYTVPTFVVTLAVTEHPATQPTGPLLILDEEYEPGMVRYSYHRDRDAAAVQALALEKSRAPVLKALLEDVEAEQRAMAIRSKSDKLIEAFLEAAPPSLRYDYLRRLIS